MALTEKPLTPVLESTHYQQWKFSRFSYLEQPRPDHGLLLVLSGQIDYKSQNGILQLKPMDLIYLPKGSRYEARFHPGTADLLINFCFLCGDESMLPNHPCRVLHDEFHALQPLMERTIALFQQGGQYFEAMALFYRVCQQLWAMLQSEDQEQALIQKAKLLLSQPDCPDLEAVARQLLISPSGLRKKFKDATGISPSQYRLQKRLEQAQLLLLSTDLPMTAIAEQCRFCDVAYFHKTFLRATGLSPTAYRQARKQV